MPKVKLQWICGYETLLFDTPSGDLEEGQYAISEDGNKVFYRPSERPKEEFNFRAVKAGELDVSGMQQVNIIGKAYYNEFLLPNGKKIRERTTAKAYWDAATIKNHPQPTKEITWP